MASHTNPGVPGIDRTNSDLNSRFHPNNFPFAASTKVPSTASTSSARHRKVHFDDESIAESSGTQPTSIGSAYGPTSSKARDKARAVVEEDGNGTDYDALRNGQLQDTLSGLGEQFGSSTHGRDLEAGVTSNATEHCYRSPLSLSFCRPECRQRADRKKFPGRDHTGGLRLNDSYVHNNSPNCVGLVETLPSSNETRLGASAQG
jgi:hypothetical protein